MITGIHRYLSEDTILLDLDDYLPEQVDEEGLPIEEWSNRRQHEFKILVLEKIVQLFDRAELLSNPSKCLTDLDHRERKASTGLQNGIALPHVRTKQAKQFHCAILRSDTGVWFDSLDSQRVHLFFAVLCPPWADKEYLSFLKSLSERIRDEDFINTMMWAESSNEIMGYICRLQKE